MSCPPEELFGVYFNELEKRGVPYVILHSWESFPDRIASDVDYAVRSEDLARVYPILNEVAARAGWRIVQTLRYEMDAYYSVLVDPERPDQFIKLDRTTHFTDNGCLFVPVEVMLDGRRKHKGFFVPRPSSEFIYALAKAFSKKKDLGDYLPHLRELWQSEPERSQELFARLFGPDAGDLRAWFKRPAAEWLTLSELMHARSRYSLSQKMREWARRAQRVLQPAGVRLAFLGPDGVGKSATISRIQKLLEPCFRRQRLFHFRPKFFEESGGAPVTEPHGQPPRGLLASWLKVIWYFGDHWVGWLFQQWPAQCRSTCIVFDRNFDDLLIDTRRYRLRYSSTLVRCLHSVLPRFDLTIILDAPAEIIRQRKPELPLEELERQRTALRRLAAGDRRCVIVSTTDTPDEVARAACRHVIRFLAERERQRFGQEL
jgi:thymidylate kinase